MTSGSQKQQKMLDDLLSTCRTHLPSVNEALMTKAFEFALEAHKNDLRASGEPYFTHPYEVAMIVASEFPLDDITVISAFLHDIVEDTEFNKDLLSKEFGKEVAEIVDGVTKISGIFKGQEITVAENYRKMLLSMVRDVRVILVKFADRLHNMRTLEYVSPEKQRRIAQETLEIYAPFANRFGLGKVKWELEDLSFKYLNKEAYEELARKIKNKRKEREAYIKKFSDPILEKIREYNIDFDISGRPKHLYSIYRKMVRRNKPFEEIYDLFAIRIILNTEDNNQCYTTLGVVNQVYMPVPDRFKDYISIPKTNNYQSIHTTVVGPEGKLVEVQIRTKKMHEVAEKGVAAHWRYKENKTTEKDLDNWVNWIRDIFENASKDEARKDLLESFKLNLYQDEIYVFTPKGDLRRLPTNSTPVDFAFEIHSKVGFHCIGAKVNGKIVPLDTLLHSGDQVEIITSKNQHPNKNWIKFVTTHKAKSAIRKWINKEEEEIVELGKELWEKKTKKLKLSFTTQDIAKLALSLKFENPRLFFKAVAQGKLNLDEILIATRSREKKDKAPVLEFESFANLARGDIGGVMVDGKEKTGILYSYAKCCNPIPGDPVIGYITVGEGIKIHRKTCTNLLRISEKDASKLIPIQWPETESSLFVAGLTVMGEDSPGILNEISHTIVSYQNTNIKSININSNNSTFDGSVTLYVQNIDHLTRIIQRLKKLKGVYTVERFESA
jgi:GTP diphosphokinase / guanosine-3',5'-bis(diphosphate) 3'-diphosphatase